jgi:uncharacterized RDD family membrane protein YckC
MESTNTSPVAAQEKALCAECQTLHNKQDMLSYQNLFICADCKPAFQQKLAEGSFAPTNRRYAGFWRRFAALMVDGVISWIVMGVGMVIIALAGGGGSNWAAAMQSGWVTLISTVFGIVYSVGMVGKYGATLGKMALGIKVVRASGAPFGYALALGRYFAHFLNAFTFGIGYLMAAWDKEKRGLHDRVCGTRVVHV